MPHMENGQVLPEEEGQLQLPLSRLNMNSIRWDPQPDITPWELAQAQHLLTVHANDAPMRRHVYRSLAPDVQRHFKCLYEECF